MAVTERLQCRQMSRYRDSSIRSLRVMRENGGQILVKSLGKIMASVPFRANPSSRPAISRAVQELQAERLCSHAFEPVRWTGESQSAVFTDPASLRDLQVILDGRSFRMVSTTEDGRWERRGGHFQEHSNLQQTSTAHGHQEMALETRSECRNRTNVTAECMRSNSRRLLGSVAANPERWLPN